MTTSSSSKMEEICTICRMEPVANCSYFTMVDQLHAQYILDEYPSLLEPWKIMQGIIYYREYRGLGDNTKGVETDPDPCYFCLQKLVELAKTVYALTRTLEDAKDLHPPVPVRSQQARQAPAKPGVSLVVKARPSSPIKGSPIRSLKSVAASSGVNNNSNSPKRSNSGKSPVKNNTTRPTSQKPPVKNTGSQKGKQQQQQQQGRPSRRSAISANERISSNTDRDQISEAATENVTRTKSRRRTAPFEAWTEVKQASGTFLGAGKAEPAAVAKNSSVGVVPSEGVAPRPRRSRGRSLIERNPDFVDIPVSRSSSETSFAVEANGASEPTAAALGSNAAPKLIKDDSKPIQAAPKPTKPASKTIKAATKSSQAATKSSQATSKPTQAASKPTLATTKPTQAASKPTLATTKPTLATTKPTQAASKPIHATLKPSQAVSIQAAPNPVVKTVTQVARLTGKRKSFPSEVNATSDQEISRKRTRMPSSKMLEALSSNPTDNNWWNQVSDTQSDSDTPDTAAKPVVAVKTAVAVKSAVAVKPAARRSVAVMTASNSTKAVDKPAVAVKHASRRSVAVMNATNNTKSVASTRRSVAAAVQKQSFDIETAAKDDQLTIITDKPTTAVKSKAGILSSVATVGERVNVGSGGVNWRGDEFRSVQLGFLDAALAQAAWSIRSGKNMEREVYTNANNMADYVAGIQKLVAHFTNQKAQGSSPTKSKSPKPVVAVKSKPSSPRKPAVITATVTKKPEELSAKGDEPVDISNQATTGGGDPVNKKTVKARKPKKAVSKQTKPKSGVEGVRKRLENPRVWGKDRKNCPVCGILQGGKDLLGHLKKEHGGGKCEHCGDLLHSEPLLNKHIQDVHGEGEKQKKGEEKENQQVLDDEPAPDSQDQQASEAKLQKRPLLKPQFIFKKSKSGKKGKKYLDSSLSDVEMAIQGKPIIKRKVPDFVDGINPILSSVQGSVAPKGPVAGELLTSTIHPQVHFEATASRQEKQPAAPTSKEASVRPQRKTRPMEERHPDFVVSARAPARKTSENPGKDEPKIPEVLGKAKGTGSGTSSRRNSLEVDTVILGGRISGILEDVKDPVVIQLDDDDSGKDKSVEAAKDVPAKDVIPTDASVKKVAENDGSAKDADDEDDESEADKWFHINRE